MTNLEKKKIKEYRLKGVGYKAIASVLGLSRDVVRNYCKTHGLDGDAAVVFLNIKEQMDRGEACICCGKTIKQPKQGRARKFCSDQCRRTWWKAHPEEGMRKETAVYTIVCKECGTAFESYGNKSRKYCSHQCYIKYRFGG